MNTSTINKHIMTLLLLLFTLQLSAVSYPSVHENIPLGIQNQTVLKKEVLESFLDTFGQPSTTDFDSIADSVLEESSAINSLRSVVNIQDIQLKKLKREKLPKFSFINTPQTPLYGYRNNTSQLGAPPATTTVESHTIGLSGAITQQLPTAGSIDLSLSNTATYSKSTTTAWTWKQSPSVALTFSQPLFINNKIIDFSYASTLLARQEEKKEQALRALDNTKDSLSLTSVTLLHTYQGLQETKWTLSQEALLSEKVVEDAKESLMLGLISENQLTLQINSYKQQLLQIAELENEIASIMSSLSSLGLTHTNGVFTLPTISYIDIEYVSTYSGNKLINNDSVLQKALTNDSDYVSALSSVRDAQFQLDLGNPADAPILSVSMNYSPFITSTGGADFGQSFSDLFSPTDHNISVSVSVIASDLSRSLSRSTTALAKEQLLQAQIALDDARKEVVETIRSMQSAINTSLEKVKINTTSYEMAREMVEIEKIKALVGQSNDEAIKRAEINMYRSAFSLLSSLRKVYELRVSLDTMMK